MLRILVELGVWGGKSWLGWMEGCKGTVATSYLVEMGEAEYAGKRSGRVGFGLPRAHPILEDRFSHHIIISIPPSFVSEARPSRSCSLGLPGGCTHGVQLTARRRASRDRVDVAHAVHARMQIWRRAGLAGLKKSCPCHARQGFTASVLRRIFSQLGLA